MSCAYMYVFLSQRKVSTLLFFYMRNYHVRMGTGSWSFWVQNKKRCPKNRLPLPKNNNEKKTRDPQCVHTWNDKKEKSNCLLLCKNLYYC
jgi:hypothetical protein